MTINTVNLENLYIGVYKNAKSIKTDSIIRLIDFLTVFQNKMKDRINTLRNIENKEKQKEYKINNLYGVTMSALFGEKRSINNIINHNNIMCIDVDEEDNKELFKKYDIEYIKKVIFDLNFVYSVSLSCRGKGFYFIVPIPDSNDISIYYTSMYYKLRKYGINIDKHCKDITRIRFISYDENILIKKDCEITVFNEVSEEQIIEKKQELIRVKRVIQRHNKPYLDSQFKLLEKSVDYMIHKGYDTGKHWSDWATVGKYLKTFGDAGKELFHRISQNSSGYRGYDDVEKNWLRFRQCKNEDEGYGKFYTMIRNIYGDNWREEMNNLINS